MQVISVSQFTAAAEAVVQVSYDQRKQMAQLLQTGFERKNIVLSKYTLGEGRKRDVTDSCGIMRVSRR